MKNKIICLFILLFFYSCSSPTRLPVLDLVKPADEFARGYIGNIFNGELDSCFVKTDPEILTDSFRENIINGSRNLKNASIKKYEIAEEYYTIGTATDGGKFEYYKLSYEYEIEGGNILFITSVSKKDDRFLITSFNGQLLPAPLAVLTEFTLKHRSGLQYTFLLLTILVPLFILFTLIAMLLGKMTRKKKIIWAFIILLVSVPRFYINWGTGQFDFNLLNFNLLGASISKATLYSYWILSFSLPIGGILFWVRRKDLLSNQAEEYNYEAVTFNTPDEQSNREEANTDESS